LNEIVFDIIDRFYSSLWFGVTFPI